MDAIDKILDDLKNGNIDSKSIANLIGLLHKKLLDANQFAHEQQKELDATNQKLDTANQRILDLEKLVDAANPQPTGQPNPQPASKPELDQSYSLPSENKRQQERGRFNAPKPKTPLPAGRNPTDEKVAKADRKEPCYPEGFTPEQCQFSHHRPVWRIEDGKLVLVAYEIFRHGNHFGQVPDVLGRSEFGIEIVLMLGYLVYVIGLSLDKSCAVLSFSLGLPLSKSQADSLLYQLARIWACEFEILCTLLAASAIVHTDETGWSIKSVWAFLSEKARLIFFGVNKNAKTLKVILDPETFLGLVFSDDAAVHGNYTLAQKCWAHLLRKLIKLTLLDPENEKYRTLLDELHPLYHRARRLREDKRYNDEGRAKKVAELEEELMHLLLPHYLELGRTDEMEAGLEKDFALLINEMFRLAVKNELFRFVTVAPAVQPNGETKPVDGTNNESERTLRGPAMARDTGRTSKEVKGARRTTIITSVFESLKLYLQEFRLPNVVAEVKQWLREGQSCFAKLAQKLKLKMPGVEEESILDRVLPLPSG